VEFWAEKKNQGRKALGKRKEKSDKAGGMIFIPKDWREQPSDS
jgi:hypothetical protein